MTIERAATEENLVVVVRTQEYVDSIDDQDGKAVFEPLIGELLAVYMVDSPDSMSPIKSSEMLGKSPPDLRLIALANVRKWYSKIVFDNSSNPIVLVYVQENTMLTTSLILLDEFWKDAEERISSDLYFVLPRRDQLFLFDAKQLKLLSAARKLVELTFQDGFNLLSDKIYRRRNGRFEVVTEG